ncbi:hypothetical protein SNEBB_005648 [Seison nebaliae]|nr:hypothetical protein SNEBB_005648 [Seison nebaliae]
MFSKLFSYNSLPSRTYSRWNVFSNKGKEEDVKELEVMEDKEKHIEHVKENLTFRSRMKPLNRKRLIPLNGKEIEEIEKKLKEIFSKYQSSSQFPSIEIKFNIINECEKLFDNTIIDSVDMWSMNSFDDVKEYLVNNEINWNNPIPINVNEMPPNVVVNAEYRRFDPNDITAAHQGKDAFPQRDTIVSSLRYRKKYDGLKKKKGKNLSF